MKEYLDQEILRTLLISMDVAVFVEDGPQSEFVKGNEVLEIARDIKTCAEHCDRIVDEDKNSLYETLFDKIRYFAHRCKEIVGAEKPEHEHISEIWQNLCRKTQKMAETAYNKQNGGSVMTAKKKAAFNEKRKFVRVPRDFVISFKELTMSDEAPEKYTSSLVNISACGILFESEKEFPENTLLKMEIQIQRWEKFSSDFIKFDQTSVSKPFVAIGKVARIEATKENNMFLLGISIENVDQTHGEALKKYLDTIKENDNKAG